MGSDMPKHIWAWPDYDGDIDGHWAAWSNQSDKVPVATVAEFVRYDKADTLRDRAEKAEAAESRWKRQCQTEEDARLREKHRRDQALSLLADAEDERDAAQAQVAALRSLVEEYYQKTPLGHQPHMISQRVEDALSNTTQAAADHDRRMLERAAAVAESTTTGPYPEIGDKIADDIRALADREDGG